MRHTTLLLALAALAATSCSLQLDSQYGLRWDRRVTVPQRVESEITDGPSAAEPEVAPDVYAVESDTETDHDQSLAAPSHASFEAALPFRIQLDDLPQPVAPYVERRIEQLKSESASDNRVNHYPVKSTGSTALKIAGVVIGIFMTLLGVFTLFLGYWINYIDTDTAKQFFQIGAVFVVLGVLFIVLPQLL